MNLDKRWLLATAALGAAAGAAITSKLLRRRHALLQHHDDAAGLKTWENEGGNLEPHAVPPAMPLDHAGL